MEKEYIAGQEQSLNNENFFVTIRFSQFRGSTVDIMEIDGNMQRCICIPIEENDLRMNDKGHVWGTMFALRSQYDVNQRGTHILKPYYDKEFRTRLESLGFSVPNVGHMRPVDYKVTYSNAFRQQAKYKQFHK